MSLFWARSSSTKAGKRAQLGGSSAIWLLQQSRSLRVASSVNVSGRLWSLLFLKRMSCRSGKTVMLGGMLVIQLLLKSILVMATHSHQLVSSMGRSSILNRSAGTWVKSWPTRLSPPVCRALLMVLTSDFFSIIQIVYHRQVQFRYQSDTSSLGMGKKIENYSLQSKIWQGMHSTVYRAINIKTKQEVAIKVVKAEKFKQFPKLEEGTYNEINILSNLEGCPHIIKVYDLLKTVNNFYFVYEYCNGGTLEKLLKEKGALPESTALTYFFQIVEAFRVLKRHNFLHRDLKPENLLMHDGVVKLSDLGCKPLQSEDEMSMTMLGSPIYMAPEVLKGERYSITADIWSLGVMLFRMFYGFCPFESSNIGKLIMVIEEEDMIIPPQPSVSPEAVKLLKRMLTKNPTLRADWAQIFAYELRNGELTRQGLIHPKTPTEDLNSANKSQTQQKT